MRHGSVNQSIELVVGSNGFCQDGCLIFFRYGVFIVPLPYSSVFMVPWSQSSTAVLDGIFFTIFNLFLKVNASPYILHRLTFYSHSWRLFGKITSKKGSER